MNKISTKFKEFFTYNEKYGCLEDIDMVINVHLNNDSWILEYELPYFDIENRHIHCTSIDQGIRMLTQEILEKTIWKLQELEKED